MAKITKKMQREPGTVFGSRTADKIFKLFIEPIISQMSLPGNTDHLLQRKLEIFFDAHSRDIWTVKAKVPFKLVGPRWLTMSTPDRLPVHGDGDRSVIPGDILWVRYDERRPEIYEVEHKDQNFLVKSSDWEVLSEKCEFIR